MTVSYVCLLSQVRRVPLNMHKWSLHSPTKGGDVIRTTHCTFWDLPHLSKDIKCWVLAQFWVKCILDSTESGQGRKKEVQRRWRRQSTHRVLAPGTEGVRLNAFFAGQMRLAWTYKGIINRSNQCSAYLKSYLQSLSLPSSLVQIIFFPAQWRLHPSSP